MISEDLQDADETKESMFPKSENGSHSFTEEDSDLRAPNRVQLEEVDLKNRKSNPLSFN